MRQLIAGNWKMFGTGSSLVEIDKLKSAVAVGEHKADILVCPPATLISRVASVAGPFVQVGAQDCHPDDFGPHTGDISAPMIKDAGAVSVILGHSERRRDHGETSAMVKAKVVAARRAGLMAIVCVGETREERSAGLADKICADAIAESLPAGLSPADFVIAYEPVWAIGTGQTATTEDIVQMHDHVRACLSRYFGAANAGNTRILYGGSANPGNAAAILAARGVNGVLVGGASLKAEEFSAIIDAVPGRD
ncbi:MAG: triose-phosphate isomerase [Alphaproteobacteria bacterium]|nr:triose-phosphate isomerase [Alphaproteobacteria bacterium]